jgi:hypothetical protein
MFAALVGIFLISLLPRRFEKRIWGAVTKPAKKYSVPKSTLIVSGAVILIELLSSRLQGFIVDLMLEQRYGSFPSLYPDFYSPEYRQLLQTAGEYLALGLHCTAGFLPRSSPMSGSRSNCTGSKNGRRPAHMEGRKSMNCRYCSSELEAGHLSRVPAGIIWSKKEKLIAVMPISPPTFTSPPGSAARIRKPIIARLQKKTLYLFTTLDGQNGINPDETARRDFSRRAVWLIYLPFRAALTSS